MRTNKRNKGLPARWRWIRSALYYDVPAGHEAKWNDKRTFRLGSTLTEAHLTWGARMTPYDTPKRCRNIEVLLEGFLKEKVPEFSPSYRSLCQGAIANLKIAFGQIRITDITPNDIHHYLNARSKKTKVNSRTTGGKVIANREIEVLQNAFSWAVFSKGYLSRHPFKDQIKFLPEKARTRYIEDWEIEEMMKVGTHRRKGSVHAIKAYIKIKLLTGMAKGDLLRLTETDLKEDGIHIQRHKVAHSTGKRTIYLWSDDLRKAIKETLAARPAYSSFLFCKKDGAGYFDETTGRADAWESIWDRFKKAVMAHTKITENFTDHDLRAKTGSDAKSVEEASKMLSHADTAVTRKHYRRKPDIVPTGARES